METMSQEVFNGLQSGRYVSHRQDNLDGMASFNMDISASQFSSQFLPRKDR